ncbi:MAG TPA: hypothetical protein VIV58_31035, partial [Kofleriaceae bacterium]
VDLAWSPVVVNATPAVAYRVYRTASADGASQQELLIATVSATSYTDTGATPQTEAPLSPGSLGVWQLQTPAHAARWGHQAAVISDGTNRYLYVLGGKSDAAAGYLTTIEVSPIDTSGHLGAFTSSGTNAFPTGRAFFSLAVETAATVAGFTGVARFFTTGGVIAGAASAEVDFADVTAGGGNAAWTSYAGAGTLGTRAGPMSVITGDKLFCVGGAAMATDTTFSNVRANGEDLPFNANGAIGSPIQSTANALPAPRALGALIAGAGFIYFAGGTSDGTDAVQTVYQTF